MEDLKPIVANSYPAIIKGTLNRILYFEADTIMNYLVRFHLQINTGNDNEKINADEALIISDKFYVYKKLWQAILETLYTTYLPHMQYEFKWTIEATPYTLMICDLTEPYAQHKDMERLKELMHITDEELETNYDRIIQEGGFGKIGFGHGLEELLPEDLIPGTRKEQLQLLFRLMSFPPLGELSIFQNYYNAFIKKQTESLSSAFNHIDSSLIPNYNMPESLHCSYFHVYHDTFSKYGLVGFENNQSLVRFTSEFKKIRNRVATSLHKFSDSLICPCCGERQQTKLPEEILQYKYLLEDISLARQVGLTYFSDFVENYNKKLTDGISTFLPNLNRVDHPDCLILVEGESEEWSIPILAFRKRFVLAQRNIQVYNSKSKEKLAADFFSFKANYPNRKIICLLDSDAKKERRDLERVIGDHMNKYRLVFIEKGTYEDIFDLDESIAVLNDLYSQGDPITRSDFDVTKDFLSNIKRIMFHKKKAQFDKVLFAKTISFKLDVEKLPKEITNLFKIAKDFTEPTKYVSQV